MGTQWEQEKNKNACGTKLIFCFPQSPPPGPGGGGGGGGFVGGGEKI
jgi:hypothetical protein